MKDLSYFLRAGQKYHSQNGLFISHNARKDVGFLMSQKQNVDGGVKPGYFGDHIDVPENKWLFDLNSLGFWSRQDGITRQEELNSQIEAYRILKHVSRMNDSTVNFRLLFNAMIYFMRFFQKRSYKYYNRFVMEAISVFVAGRILEIHRSIDEIVGRFPEVPPNKQWDLKDKIRNTEMTFMGELCYDLIITNPFQILITLLNYRGTDNENQNVVKLNKDLIYKDVSKMIESSIITQIYLLYPIDFCVKSYFCCVLVRRKLQLSKEFLEQLPFDITASAVMEFFKVYNRLVSEIVQARGLTYVQEYDFSHITETRLQYILNDLDNYPDDEEPSIRLPSFKVPNQQIHPVQQARHIQHNPSPQPPLQPQYPKVYPSPSTPTESLPASPALAQPLKAPTIPVPSKIQISDQMSIPKPPRFGSTTPTSHSTEEAPKGGNVSVDNQLDTRKGVYPKISCNALQASGKTSQLSHSNNISKPNTDKSFDSKPKPSATKIPAYEVSKSREESRSKEVSKLRREAIKAGNIKPGAQPVKSESKTKFKPATKKIISKASASAILKTAIDDVDRLSDLSD